MGAMIPEVVRESDISRKLAAAGLKRIHQGKVRDTHALPDPKLLLQVTTKRTSIFDFVLSGLLPDKGDLLTAATVFWLDMGPRLPCRNHLVAFGRSIDRHLPALKGDIELQSCGVIVKKLKMLPVEFVVRGYLTGSGWRSYQKTGEVCGHKLPRGLQDGSRLPEPLLTPTTKAETGHDLDLNVADVQHRYGWVSGLALKTYQVAHDFALKGGIIIADTKFEFGEDGTLADEVLTPDASRLWYVEEWAKALKAHRTPPPHDKEYMRNWGMTVKTPFMEDGQPIVGLRNLNPENPGHLAFVHSIKVPDQMLGDMSALYHGAFERLTGFDLSTFKLQGMGIGA